MAKSIAVAVALLVLVMVSTVPHAESTFTCASLVKDMTPCIPFLKGKVNSAPPNCCTGARTLNSKINTTPERQRACKCLKPAAGALGVRDDRAVQLPKKCNIKLNVPFTSKVDCSKVK